MKKIIFIYPENKVRTNVNLFALYISIILFAFCLIYNQEKIQAVIQDKAAALHKINLEKEYEENNQDKIKSYFMNWNKESIQLTKSSYSNATEESLYQIYYVLFQPYELEPLVDELMLDYYEKDLIEVINQTPYVITQNKINYILLDFDEAREDILKHVAFEIKFGRDDIHVLEDFYPTVALEKKRVLHMTEEYEEEITTFLGSTEQPLGEKHIMGPSVPKGETEKRYQFLRKYVPILYGHWGGYWHLSTHPQIELVYLDNDLKHAVAQYRIGYNFGYAEFVKEEDSWKLVRAKMMGME